MILVVTQTKKGRLLIAGDAIEKIADYLDEEAESTKCRPLDV